MYCDSEVGWPYDIAGVYDANWRLTYDGAVFGSDSLSVGDVSSSCAVSTDTDRSDDATREGPFEAVASPMDTEDSPLVTTGLPGCPYRITSYIWPALADMNPAFGLQLHHLQFLEFIGAPESARLLYHSPSFWVDRLGEECAMAAAVNLQRDAVLMLSNLQIISQFIMSLHRMSSEMMSIGIGRVVFPANEIADLLTIPRAPWAAKYMAAMGMWHPQTGPGDPVRASAHLAVYLLHEVSVLFSGGSATSGEIECNFFIFSFSMLMFAGTWCRGVSDVMC